MLNMNEDPTIDAPEYVLHVYIENSDGSVYAVPREDMPSSTNGWTWALFAKDEADLYGDCPITFGGRMPAGSSSEAIDRAWAHLDEDWDIDPDDIAETHIHRGDFTPAQVLTP